MTNAKVKFKIDGVERSLYFGMVATQIFSEKAANTVTQKLNSNDVKTLAYLVYAGLCNQADLSDDAYPSFEQAYELTEKIIDQLDSETQATIFKTWAESKPAKDMMAQLPKAIDEVNEEGKKKESPKQKQLTGTKLKPSHTEN